MYFREEEDKEDEEDSKADSVKVSEYTAAQYFYIHTIFRSGTALPLLRTRKIDFPLLPLSAGDGQLSGSIQTAGGSRFLLGRGTELPEACLCSAGGRLQ